MVGTKKDGSDVTQDEYNAYYSKIDDKLYQSGQIGRYVALPTCIDAILNLDTVPDTNIHLSNWMKAQCWMPIDDVDFPGVCWLNAAVDLVLGWQSIGWTVLVHCAAGISRSSLVTVGVMMKDRRWTFDKAMNHLGEKRPQIQPNRSYQAGLHKYKEFLDGGC